MRKDEIFMVIVNSYMDLAERAVVSDKTLTEEQRAKQLDIVRRAVDVYKEMYFEEEETYESRRNDLRQKR